MSVIKTCSPCLHRGRICDSNPDGCHRCLRGAFICPCDYQECPTVPQPGWTSDAAPQTSIAAVSQVPSQQIAHDHANLIQNVSQLYQTLVDMQYIQGNDILRPPQTRAQLNLAALVEAGYRPDTIALLLQMPHIKSSSVEIAPQETLPFPYLNLDDLHTVSGTNNPRDPLDHPDEENWTIPPWTFFLTRPAPHREVDFAYCRIYDTRSKSLGLWSDSLRRLDNEPPRALFLIDARSPREVIGEWIGALKSLQWVPSLSQAEGKIYTPGQREVLDQMLAMAQTMPAEIVDGFIGVERRRNNMYWAQRRVYEECGWPDQLNPGELTRRRAEWNETVARLSGDELESYYRRLAGEHAI
ncbi:hypothetical protein ATEIFO6365_0002001200 [Aspergillus terreus]|uniref:Uncharacterized protein n=1 Tax=Aspergillus terreus TaxID=33178 RepID=A0A5M3YXU7_ASPTE|nr:hypothetical protein ATETN484_0004001200 [Aspergillus terreus]GFF12902.1 hypothetical protein ATEIFO6365_0002001200 [Aspergillus terreus]